MVKDPIKKEKRRQKELIYNKLYRQRHRNAIIELLGGKCVRCGFKDIRALQVDHINGGGNKERKNIKGTYFRRILIELSTFQNKYQLLCANCNWIKKNENNETKPTKYLWLQ